jgi:tripartite-type tricarboxylate transporter receptor subunit TctC
MMSRLRAARDSVFAAVVAIGLGWTSGAAAQNYPAKPIRLVVPFAPGGPADVIGRIIGQQLDIILGQSIVVENRGGAGGTIGARLAATADPDGYRDVRQYLDDEHQPGRLSPPRLRPSQGILARWR